MNLAGDGAELALRRRLLVLRSAALRGALARHSQALEAPFAAADRVRAGARWLYAQRALVTLGVVVVLVVRPRRAVRVARFGWWAWRSARRLMPWLVAAGFVMPTRARGELRPTSPRPGGSPPRAPSAG